MYYADNATVSVKGSSCTILNIEHGSVKDKSSTFVYKIKMQNSEYALKSWVNQEKIIYNAIHALERTGGHPNIIELVKSDCVKLDVDFQGLLILEYCPGGTLDAFINLRHSQLENPNSLSNPTAYLKDEQVMQIFTCIVSAVAHLHALEPPLFHWNISSTNIMLVHPDIPINDFTCVKLIDFNISSSAPIVTSTLPTNELNNLITYYKQHTNIHFRSPELTTFNQTINASSDIWSLGCLLHHLLFLSNFDTSNTYQFPTTPKVAPFFDILSSKLLLTNPNERLSAYLLLAQCRDFFIGALPSWITRKYLPSATVQPSTTSIPIPNNNTPTPTTPIDPPSLHYSATHILDIAGFNDIKSPITQINFQFPQSISVSLSSVVFTIPLLLTDHSASKHNVHATCAIYHPIKHLLITSLASSIDIYNVQLKQRIISQSFPIAPILQLSWLNDSTICLITDESIYHLVIDQTPLDVTEMCGIFQSVIEHPILYYDCDSVSNPQWLLLCSPNPEPSNGQIQLHSISKNGSQIIPGELARLFKSKTALYLLLVNRGQNHTYLHMVPVDDTASNGPQSLQLPTKDTICQLQVDQIGNRAYTCTSNGTVMIYDLTNQQVLYNTQLLNNGGFMISMLDSAMDALYGIDKMGKLWKVGLETASKQKTREMVEPQKNAIEQRQDQIASMRNVKKKEAEPVPLDASIATMFNEFLLRVSKHELLDKDSSIKFARYGNTLGLGQLITSYIEEGRLTTSEALGDELIKSDKSEQVALLCYKQANCHRKVIRIMARNKDYNRIILYLRGVDYTPEDQYIMDEICYGDTEVAMEYGTKYYGTTNKAVIMTKILEIMQGHKSTNEAIAFLKQTLVEDDSEYSYLQTELLKMVFQVDVKEAESILSSNKYTQYDKWTISTLCIQNGLYAKAILLYKSREQLFKSDTRLSSNPVYMELGKYVLQNNKWNLAINTLNDVEDDQERLGDMGDYEVDNESQFGCIMRSLLEGHVLMSVDSTEVIMNMLLSLIKYKKKYWIKHVLSELVISKSTFGSNMTLQTMYCLITLLFRETDEFQPIINKLHHYDHFTVSKTAKVMGHTEDAFRILERFREYPEAAEILVYELNDLARALEFADKVDKETVWPIVGKGILDAMRQNTKLRLELRRSTD